jgi:hypothetical protein
MTAQYGGHRGEASEYGGRPGLVQPPPHPPTAYERLRAQRKGATTDQTEAAVLAKQQRGQSGD